MNGYFNTVGHSGRQLELLRANAMSQEERVLKLMQTMRGHRLTAWHVQQYAMPNTPITSVRRCLTNLTTQGHLKVIGKVADGPFGHKCHQYEVAA